MEVRDLNTWNELAKEFDDIQSQYGKYMFKGRGFPNRILYRGQANDSWSLRTTLERFSQNKWTIISYMKVAHACLPQLESYLGRAWQIPKYWPEVKDEAIHRIQHKASPIPHYEYWVYLRHNGFPSPLLDWSQSPYIASFFAFDEHCQSDRVAIYAYIEKTDGTKWSAHSKPRIEVQGPYVRTDKRHFLQQAWYTVAYNYGKDDHEFVPHERVFEDREEGQDILLKLTIPRTERIVALTALNAYNITRYSLFQTEESLVKTLAFCEIEEKGL